MRWVLRTTMLIAAIAMGNAALAEEPGRFHISASTEDWKRAWRIDTKTGEGSICSLAPDFSGCRKLPEGEPLPKNWRQSLKPGANTPG